MKRRDFLRAGAGVAGVAAVGGVNTACAPAMGVPAPTSVWSAGVASGLHSPTQVVLWTRVEPTLAPGVTTVLWEVATSPAFTTVVASGSAPVSALADNTVKVLVGGLSADQSYWYRFDTGTDVSPVGRARTVPLPNATPARLNLAVASCQSYASGFYGAWASSAAAVRPPTPAPTTTICGILMIAQPSACADGDTRTGFAAAPHQTADVRTAPPDRVYAPV